MNRFFRRMQRFGKSWLARGTPRDVSSVRAKNAGHGKKKADKWNQ